MIDKGTYRDRVVEFLYEQLRSGELLPGDKVLEVSLAEQLKISRAPIREALKQMVGDGLFEYRPQIGTFVTRLTDKEIIDAYVTRGVLEGFSVASALGDYTQADYLLLQEQCRQMEELACCQEQLKLIELGRDFHSLLFQRCDNQQLIEYTERLSSKLHYLFYKHWAGLYTPKELRDRHEHLLDRMLSGQHAPVEQAFRQHYLETGKRVAELYQQKQEEP
jgi:DNA-binding GntR family transcriptional regulator